MKSSVNYKFQVLSRLLVYFHWNDDLFIMHNFVTLIFKSTYFPSSHHPIPSHNRFFAVCTQASFPTHSLLTYPHWLPLPAALPRSPWTSTLLEPMGSFPTLSDLIHCSFQVSWTLAPWNTFCSFHAVILWVFYRPLWPFCSLQFPLQALFLCWFLLSSPFVLIFH